MVDTHDTILNTEPLLQVFTMNSMEYTPLQPGVGASTGPNYATCTITSDLHPLVGVYTPFKGQIEIRLWNQVKRISVSSESDAEKAFNSTVWSVML